MVGMFVHHLLNTLNTLNTLDSDFSIMNILLPTKILMNSDHLLIFYIIRLKFHTAIITTLLITKKDEYGRIIKYFNVYQFYLNVNIKFNI